MKLCKLKNKLFFGLVAAILFSAAFISCKSSNVVPEVYEPFDYTQENAVQEEIKRICEIEEKGNVVKALWRAYILKENSSSFELASNKYSELEQKTLSLFTEEYEKQNYIEAKRLYVSLKNCNENSVKNLAVSEAELNDKCSSVIPVLEESGNKPGAPNVKVSTLIKGTVTVFVDKGIKIEKGVGYADSVLGSGFFIAENGYIITNHHVISDVVDKKYEGTAKLYIKLAEDSDTRIPAKVVGYDSTIDLALLKAEIDSPYVFTLGSSNDLDVGDRVYAIGSPLGLERTLTSGIISSTDRNLFIMGKVFQLDAAINSGNSGGPLIDEKGRVQAIVFAGVANYQGLNFAIPVEYLRYALPYLFDGGELQHSWIGCYGKTKKEPGVGKDNEGVSVLYTMPGSSSYLAGIEEGYTIISFNGKEVKTLDQLQNEMLMVKANTIVQLEALNENGEKKNFIVYLEARPKNPGYSIYCHDILAHALKPILGMELKPSSASNKNQYVISKVLRGSVAEDSGYSEDDEVQVLRITLLEENSYMYVEMYGKKRKSGYLNVGIGLTASMDSPNYF